MNVYIDFCRGICDKNFGEENLEVTQIRIFLFNCNVVDFKIKTLLFSINHIYNKSNKD